MRDNLPIVTIAMVTYNSEMFVQDAIASVLNSSYTNFELLLIDDCSKDATWTIVEDFDDSRIRAYKNENNLGEYENRQKALDLAQGKYIIYIDGDDMIYPHGLEFMVKMMEAFPDCAMGLMRWFRNNVFYPVRVNPRQFFIGEYFGHGFLGTAFTNVIFKTEVLIQSGGLVTQYASGDDYIRYKIASTHTSVLFNDSLTWWRETPGQASQQLNKSVEKSMEGFDMRLAFLNAPQCPLSERERKEAELNLKSSLYRIMLKATVTGNLAKAAYIKRHFAINPLDAALLRHKQITKDPFGEYTPIKPIKEPFENNPYSPNYNESA